MKHQSRELLFSYLIGNQDFYFYVPKNPCTLAEVVNIGRVNGGREGWRDG